MILLCGTRYRTTADGLLLGGAAKQKLQRFFAHFKDLCSNTEYKYIFSMIKGKSYTYSEEKLSTRLYVMSVLLTFFFSQRIRRGGGKSIKQF